MNDVLRPHIAEILTSVTDHMSTYIAVLDADGTIIWANSDWQSHALPAIGHAYSTLCSTPHSMLGARSGEICAGLAAVLSGELSTYTCETRHRQSTSNAWYRVTVTALHDDTLRAVMKITDISAQRQSERDVYDANWRFAVLAGISSRLGESSADLQSLLHNIASEVANAFNAGCILRLANDEGLQLDPVTLHHPDERMRRRLRQELGSDPMPITVGFPGQVYQSGVSINIFPVSGERWTSATRPDSEFHDTYTGGAILIAPVRTNTHILGTLGVLRSEPVPFSHGDQWLLEELGRRAGQAVEHARLYRETLLAKSRLQTVVEHVPAAVYSITLGEVHSTQYMNSRVADILGYHPDEFTSDSQFWLNHVHPDDRARLIEAGRHFRSGVPLDEEYRMIASDGRIVWLWDRAGFIRDEDGNPTQVQGVIVDITARKQFEELQARQLRMAFHDPLTDLPNRALFVDRVAHALNIASRTDASLGVLQIEVDHFKIINDSLGRQAGDEVLRGIAERLRHCARPGDTVARIGGDEFGILLEQSDRADMTDVTRCIVEALRAGFDIGGRTTYIASSIGAALREDDITSAEELMHNADVALHEAKSLGGGRLEIFDPSMRTRVLQRLDLENDLRQSVARGELRLVYQPKVDLATGRVVAFEALIRWNHPTRGLITPDQFIPLAEQSGLILPIGEWVMWEACRQARTWADTVPNFNDISVNVNLSGRQFQDPGLLDCMKRILQETAITPKRIGLEITESVAMDDANLTIELFHGLKELGLQLAIDDFGTGYSSLAYLKRFPVDLLKIDRSFVARLNEADNQAIVSTIIHLGHALDMRTVAEGIEADLQLQQLRTMGCDLGQGYFFSHPVAPEYVPGLLTGSF